MTSGTGGSPADGRWARRILFGGMVALTLLSFATTAAMTVSSAVFERVSAAAGVVFGYPTVLTKQQSEVADVRKQLDDERNRSQVLQRRLSETTAENDRLKREVDERTASLLAAEELLLVLERALVEARRILREKSERIATRVSLSASRAMASASGKALPVAGVAVIIAATAYELYDACETMQDLRDLDVLLSSHSPLYDSPISEREVCGMQAPTAEEIWTSVKASPYAAWSAAADKYQKLAETDPDALLGANFDRLMELIDWLLPNWGPWSEASAPQGPP